jgi:hypothetical protein
MESLKVNCALRKSRSAYLVLLPTERFDSLLASCVEHCDEPQKKNAFSPVRLLQKEHKLIFLSTVKNPRKLLRERRMKGNP